MYLGIGFDLHQEVGCDERRNFDHGGCGTYFAEDLWVHCANLTPA